MSKTVNLNLKNLTSSFYAQNGYILPKYDIAKVTKATLDNPTWVHFGAGNIFRAFPAKCLQQLLNNNEATTGIIIAEGFDYEIIDAVFKPYDNLTLDVTLRSDASIQKEVIASMVAAYKVDPSFEQDFAALEKAFINPSLQMVSFTITEKGYQLQNSQGYYTNVKVDFVTGLIKPTSYLGKVVYFLHKRFLSGMYPLTLVSMDNCSHNGLILKKSILEIANELLKNQQTTPEFIQYLTNNVAYPCSMIDKITPRPDNKIAQNLESEGFLDNKITVTNKNTYVASFVNGESTQYLIIEDNFKNGRPALEKAGFIFTSMEIVDQVEKMKVCTCLNPLHTVLAIYGCLLGYNAIYEEMKDKELVNFIKIVGYTEGLPVVVDPKIINPKNFIDEVINERLPNPFIPDTPQRIATDTSQKLKIRFGETIKAYVSDPSLNQCDLIAIPLVLAGWIRYLLALDDNLTPFTLSPDPLLNELQVIVENIEIGQILTINDLEGLLRDSNIFGVDLIEIGLAAKVIAYLNELLAGKGAIRKTLNKYFHN